MIQRYNLINVDDSVPEQVKQPDREQPYSDETLKNLKAKANEAKEAFVDLNDAEFKERSYEDLYKKQQEYNKALKSLCDELIKQNIYDEKTKKSVEALIYSYQKLEFFLIQIMHQFLKTTVKDLEKRSEDIQKEIELKQTKTESLDSDKINFQSLDSIGSAIRFIRQQVSKERIREIEIDISCKKPIEEQFDKEIKICEDNIKRMKFDQDNFVEYTNKLKKAENARSFKSSLSMIETWALQAMSNEANIFKQIILSLFARKDIQNVAQQHKDYIDKADNKILNARNNLTAFTNSKNITNLETYEKNIKTHQEALLKLKHKKIIISNQIEKLAKAKQAIEKETIKLASPTQQKAFPQQTISPETSNTEVNTVIKP